MLSRILLVLVVVLTVLQATATVSLAARSSTNYGHDEGNQDLVQRLKYSGRITSEIVEDTFLAVDRKWFAPPESRKNGDCYSDRPLHIGYEVTISAPHMHAIMLEHLAPKIKTGSRVLDVGTGSGIIVAYFAELCGPTGLVAGVEYIPQIKDYGVKNLKAVKKYREMIEAGSIVIKQGDGYQGFPEYAPFDVIHVGAAAEEIPDALVKQLANGGRMLIPVGPQGQVQQLVIVEKDDNGKVFYKREGDVMFVPLVKD